MCPVSVCALSDFEIKWSTYMTARRAVAAKSAEMEEKLAKAEKGALPPCVFKPVNEAVYLETGRVMSMYLGMATIENGKYKVSQVRPESPEMKVDEIMTPKTATASPPGSFKTSTSTNDSFVSAAPSAPAPAAEPDADRDASPA